MTNQPRTDLPQPPEWWQSLHHMWLQAMRVTDVTMIADSVYASLAAHPAVVVVIGSRWTSRGGSYIRSFRPGDAQAITRRPGDPDWPDSAEWPPALADGREPAVGPATAGEGSRLARAGGGTHVMECVFPLGPDDSAGLWLGLSESATEADTRMVCAQLAQVADVLIASNRHLLMERLHERRRARDAFLAEASLQMDASLDAEETLRRVARLAVPAVAEGCVVHLASANGGLAPVAVAHVAATVQRWLKQSPDGSSWLTDVVHRHASPHRTVLLSGAEIARDSLEEPWPFGDVGAMSVSPLQARGRTLGTLTFLYGRDDVEDDHVRMVDDVARRAALAIDTTTLYEQRRRHVEALQQSLLPPRLPQVEGLELSAAYAVADDTLDVGGDFYDVVVSEDRVCLFIGDVCGRGAEAAALTGLARHTLRTVLEDGVGPGPALSRLNQALVREKTSRFVTALVVALERTDRGWSAEVANAGHPWPLWRRADGRVQAVESRGLLLGVVPDAHYSPERLHLTGSDALVLFTDGLIEARSADGTQFEEQLPEIVSKFAGSAAGSAAADLIAASTAFRQLGDDDTAVLIAKVKS
ncbi:GAF domain-containing SpoIIE family protein phosphatase [Streptomyces sp. NPDC001904]|uniref:PP2C family protein-serine/threonine phosphatase n=1 Tax=Streptomyces sp. NPDC001904 TaxID=3154531 RepID=UPI0033299240